MGRIAKQCRSYFDNEKSRELFSMQRDGQFRLKNNRYI